jgi:hypothetical protein
MNWNVKKKLKKKQRKEKTNHYSSECDLWGGEQWIPLLN